MIKNINTNLLITKIMLYKKIKQKTKIIFIKNKWRLRSLLPVIEKYKHVIVIIYQIIDKYVVFKNNKFKVPRGYIYSTFEYINQSQNNDFYINIYEQEKIKRKLPICIDEKVKQGFSEHAESILPEQRVYHLHNVRFWGHYGGTLITPLNQVLADISPDIWGIEKHTIFTKFRLPRCIEIKGKTVILSTPEAASNYWHWTFDLLPRFDLLLKSGVKLDSIDNFIINHTKQQYQLESLKELGIPEEKIICCNSNSHFHTEYAIIPNLCPSENGVHSWKKDFLKKLNFKKLETKKLSKIYISRQRSQQRRFINEKEIESIITNQGFSTIYLEDYSIAEQRTLFYNADCILGIHGAGFSNIIFCKENTKIIEIFPPNYIQYYYWYIADMLNLNYRFIVANKQEHTNNVDRMIAEDILLDVFQLSKYLEKL
ncbi:MAG: glycosyltransferase family 61 protein [Mojavia pulchra JT2-VF2]|jgi:capsular polysaccharide biosynthesis protein|uniref:Glycosyltransferase family 61 protein n=1 Tax=Mojavia pulchra JT2-VF2 TaxID=287848 RepID=A0A951UF72_9NOST|nr:glycosyltransferase family 61 protein [Mojavia pulchra JT2-VF2]